MLADGLSFCLRSLWATPIYKACRRRGMMSSPTASGNRVRWGFLFCFAFRILSFQTVRRSIKCSFRVYIRPKRYM
ncbi:hypothetical protein HanHA300_Chr02g0057561 [Helianthus annuus]|nr:hypothetical protein HanHA300_Chr02g0057561 [Helianthus annuus]KAJ0618970.1 hypothetical protein HanHA89_Chr02g0066061 [Helianthus annuus]KAJ0777425.1 hypothetical protein HanLR1_Chr02g0060341 [Helianthus annuus]